MFGNWGFYQRKKRKGKRGTHKKPNKLNIWTLQLAICIKGKKERPESPICTHRRRDRKKKERAKSNIN